MHVLSLLPWRLRRARAVLTALLSLFLLLGTLPAAPAVQAAPGDLDPTFGNNGIVTTSFPAGPDNANAVAVQADGKILVAGSAYMGGTGVDFALARYNPDGSLDTSFDGDGIVTTPIGSGSADDYAYALAIQADGKILAAGYGDMGDTGNDFVLVRYQGDAPTAISLSAGSVDENAAISTTVGALSVTDPDGNDSHTFSLVAGPGGTDNGSFTIQGDQLLTNGPFDFESQSQYSIRVRVRDKGDLFFDQPFTITVNNLNEAPTAISLSAGSVDEGAAISTTVGTLSAADPDAGDNHTFSLVAGPGDTDNASFTIDGDQLLTKGLFDFETQSLYSIRVSVSDSGGLSIAQPFTITVNNVNEAPVAVDDVVDPATTVFVGNGGSIAVLDNDTDPDGDLSLSVSALGVLTSGAATTDGTLVTFDPPDDANGTATFSYTLSDNHAPTPLTDEGLVTVTYVANDPRGDCNADRFISADDFDATVLEYFDDPADAPWWQIYADGFPGSPQGCNSNADQTSDIADLVCTVRLAHGDTCGAEVTGAAATQATLHVDLKVHEQTAVAHLSILEETAPEGTSSVAAAAFRLRYDPAHLVLDPTDADGDGRPDSVQVSLPAGFDAWVTVDEQQGEVQVAVAAVTLPIQPLPSGEFMTIRFSRLSDDTPQLELHHLSAGDAAGATLPIQATGDVTQENPRLFLPAVLH